MCIPCSEVCDRQCGTYACECDTEDTCERCDDGWHGDICNTQCQSPCRTCVSTTYCTSCMSGYYLQDSTCHPCKAGCLTCLSSNDCSQCMMTFYRSGTDCISCSNGCSSVCDSLYGTCSCKMNFNGDKCDTCIDGWYGANCNYQCRRSCRTCTALAHCESCADGYYTSGTDCVACSDGCSNQCDKRNGNCNCKWNYTGYKCDTCIATQYGTNCTSYCKWPCKSCTSTNDCTSCADTFFLLRGICSQCKPKCAQCSHYNVCTLCMNGFYSSGIDCVSCSKRCSNQCDNGTGYCSCKREYTGNKCDSCIDGRFGTNCNYHCQRPCLSCIANSTDCTSCVDGFSGEKCERCRPHFRGVNCDQCVQNYYGTSCDQTCPEHCNKTECDRINGTCTHGCVQNFAGYKCKECVQGRYGQDCSENCPANCNGACNRFGYCKLCKLFFRGNTCDECTVGMHGTDCNLICPTTCKNHTCNRRTGTCTSCNDGFYGDTCLLNCSDYCSNETCDMETGVCYNGCIPGYSGDKCCLKGPNCNTCSVAIDCTGCKDACYDSCSTMCAYSCGKERSTCTSCVKGFHGTNCTLFQPETYDVAEHESDSPVVTLGAVGAVLITCVATLVVIKLVKKSIRKHRHTSDRDVVAFNNERVYENEPDFISLEDADNGNQYVPIEFLGAPTVPTSKEVHLQIQLDDQYPSTSSQDHAIYSQPNKVIKKAKTTTAAPALSIVSALSEYVEEQENEFYNNCTSTTGVDVNNLSTYVEQKVGGPFQTEFQQLPTGLIKPTEEAMKDHNISKNRYNGIFPYDETRVILNGPGSDFINASYIEGFHRRREYIASFGPIAKATEGFRTFWRMVWQEKTDKIVMVTNLKESSGMKCEQYWPDVNKTQQYGDVRVTCHSEDVYAEYTVRSFTVKKGKRHRSLHHIHFSAWRDKGVPDDVTSLIEFRNKVNSTKVTLGGPVIVHCSAGVGRTGTFIALDILTYKGKRIGKVDIFDCVEKLRQQRTGMVQTPDQYEYIYRALVHTLTLGSEAIRAETFRSHLSSVTEHDIKTKFEMMCHIKEKISDEEREAVVKITREFKHLNRDGADIPGDSNRLQLFLGRTTDDNNYINAVYVDSFKLKNQFIVTQTPLPTTVNDFLTLVVQTNCACIVSMDPIDVANKDIGTYLPADNQVLRSESFEVTSTKLKSNNSYSLRRLVIKAKLMGNFTTCTVHHFQCTNWPGTSKRPIGTESVLQLVNEVVTTAEESMSSSPIIVHCVTGAERSGLLCVVVSLLQKMEIEHEVSVINTIRQVKVRRPKAIPNKEQFMFCHECVAAYLQTFDIYSNFS